MYGKLRPYLNKVVIADSDGVCSTEIVPISGNGFLYNRYLFYWLKHPDFLAYVTQVGYGVNMPRLGTKEGIAAPFILAPIAEQNQIADKLDELLAQVDSIKTRLDTIPKILKRFRQSVLAAAISGKLTEDFRGNVQLHKAKIENISVLVTKGASPNWQGINYVDDPNQTLFVTSENVGGMKILLDNPKYVEDEFNEKQQRSLLMKGDVLTNIVGASIGRAVVWDKNIKANINQAVCIIRLDKNKCIADYLCYFLNSPIGIDALIANKVDVARANVSLGSVKSLELFLPDLSEQTEIIRRVEQLFTYADQIEQRVKDAQARVNQLTQSILAKAFRGELTAEWREQNPDLISEENSAESLLKRIQLERTAENTKSKTTLKVKKVE